MKFQCDKGHIFLFPAIQHNGLNGSLDIWTETKVCPFCNPINAEISEFIEPAPAQEAVSNVYVYDLTSGAQTELDKLLGQGYKIVNRYSKQYHLEKPKPTET